MNLCLMRSNFSQRLFNSQRISVSILWLFFLARPDTQRAIVAPDILVVISRLRIGEHQLAIQRARHRGSGIPVPLMNLISRM